MTIVALHDQSGGVAGHGSGNSSVRPSAGTPLGHGLEIFTILRILQRQIISDQPIVDQLRQAHVEGLEILGTLLQQAANVMSLAFANQVAQIGRASCRERV